MSVDVFIVELVGHFLDSFIFVREKNVLACSLAEKQIYPAQVSVCIQMQK